MSCPSRKQWFVCSKGDFRGCCSIDPCTDGVCPDYDTNTIDPSATTSPTTATSVASEASSSTTVQTDSIVTVTHIHTQSSSPTSTPTTSGAPVGSNSSVNGTMIGGIVAGAAALAAILAVIVCICRRRRKQGKLFTLLPSSVRRRDRYDGDEKAGFKIKYPFGNSQYRNDREQSEDTQITSDRTTTTNSSSYTSTSPGLTLSPLTSSPDSKTQLLQTDKHKRTPTTTAPFLPPIPPTIELLASTPPQEREQNPTHNPTSELSDTGFYRQRAELATHSQSELINVPVDQRRNKVRPLGVPVRVKGADTGQGQRRYEYAHEKDEKDITHAELTPIPLVITSDGAILSSNFNDEDESRSIPEPDRVRGKMRSGGRRRHVMSFMQYDSCSGSDSPLRGSLGRENDDVGLGLGLKGVNADGKREKNGEMIRVE